MLLPYRMSTERKAVVKNADMTEEMQQDAVDLATQAIEKYNIEKVSLTLVSLPLDLSTLYSSYLDQLSLHR